jgi:hypothetical protein
MDKKWIFLIAAALLVFIALCIVVVVVLIFLGIIGIPMIFYLLGLSNPSTAPRQCTMPPGLSCVSYKLHANSGELDLNIGQGTGHTMNITGVACTSSSTTPGLDKYASEPITIHSGSMAYVSQSGTSQMVKCTDNNGNLPSDRSAGTLYSGRIYIRYTEVDTGINRTATGTISTKYEA